MKDKARFIGKLGLEEGQKSVVFGTSLSFHLAPILRTAFQRHFNDGASAKRSSDAAGQAIVGRTARPLLEACCEGVREVASARGLTLIDAEELWNFLRLRDEAPFCSLLPDGVHPTLLALREHLVPFLERQPGISPEQS